MLLDVVIQMIGGKRDRRNVNVVYRLGKPNTSPSWPLSCGVYSSVYHGRTHIVIFHILRNPYLWKRLQTRTRWQRGTQSKYCYFSDKKYYLLRAVTYSLYQSAYVVTKMIETFVLLLLFFIILNCSWVDTRWQQYSTHLHTNGTCTTIKKKKKGSAGRATSLRVIPWHLPYNWGRITEKPQLG
jgi:hypothetical protein